MLNYSTQPAIKLASGMIAFNGIDATVGWNQGQKYEVSEYSGLGARCTAGAHDGIWAAELASIWVAFPTGTRVYCWGALPA